MRVDVDGACQQLVHIVLRKMNAGEESCILDIDVFDLLPDKIALDLIADRLVGIEYHRIHQPVHAVLRHRDLHQLLHAEFLMFIHHVLSFSFAVASVFFFIRI